MKKLTILGVCAMTAIGASAQVNVVKEAERQMKSNIDNYPVAVQMLTPTFSDAETKDTAYPYFVAGKGGYDYYDKAMNDLSAGKNVDKKAMGRALLSSYDFLKQAISRDTVVDEKGKAKTKYSKDIVKLIDKHYYEYPKAGGLLWEVQDYEGAYDAWEVFAVAPFEPLLGTNVPKYPGDSVVAEIRYNQALAAYQSHKLDDAITAFDRSMALGYNKKQVYDYAIAVASAKGDPDLMAHYAEIAYPIYGDQDSKYVGYIVNAKIKHEQYAEAQKLLEDIIANDPNNAQLYYVLGIVYDTQEKMDDARENYRKAVELDPENSQALFQLGRQICNQAYILSDEAQQKSNAEYNQLRDDVINPLFLDAAKYLEKAYQLNPDNTREALNFLRNIYYNVHDDDNLKRIENEMKY